MKNIMVDMETLGTTADAVILSIGAVKFDLEGAVDDEGFYASISVDSNLEVKRKISEDTLIWWFKQGSPAQGVFHESKQTLKAALCDFADWMGDDKYCMWSNGADFDLPMLNHAYSCFAMEPPWKFLNSRCFRTYKNLPGASKYKVPHSGVKHNALSDAHNQVQTLQAIHNGLFSKTKVTI